MEVTFDYEVLPHSLEAEQSVIGSILLGQSLQSVDEILTPDKFYDNRHADLFGAAIALSDEGKPIDIVSITAQLQQDKKIERIGVTYISNLLSSTPTSANLHHYADVVHETYMKRQIISEAQKQLKAAWEAKTPYEAIASMEASVTVLADQAAKPNDFKLVKDIAIETFEIVEDRFMNRHEDGVTGIPSGYNDLDKMTAGWQKSDLIIIAARPSVGKTALALNMAQHAAIRGHNKVAMFSLEMSDTQLVQRMMSAENNIDATKIRTGFLNGDDWERMTMAVSSLSTAPIFIDDSPTLTVQEIAGKCRRLNDKYGLDMVIIDYLQLISGNNRKENRVQEVSEISRKLKQLARELNVPVIALSQLSRAVEQRQDKRPIMSDLRESGSIEQDADVVAFLYRDDYYNKDSEKKNIIEINIAKQRNGPVGTVELAFLKNYNKFTSLESPVEESNFKSNKPIPDMYRG